MDSVGSVEKSIPLTLAPPSSYNVLRFTRHQDNSHRKPMNPFKLSPFGGFDEDELLTAPYKQ